jgi:hypothetical protein
VPFRFPRIETIVMVASVPFRFVWFGLEHNKLELAANMSGTSRRRSFGDECRRRRLQSYLKSAHAHEPACVRSSYTWVNQHVVYLVVTRKHARRFGRPRGVRTIDPAYLHKRYVLIVEIHNL